MAFELVLIKGLVIKFFKELLFLPELSSVLFIKLLNRLANANLTKLRFKINSTFEGFVRKSIYNLVIQSLIFFTFIATDMATVCYSSEKDIDTKYYFSYINGTKKFNQNGNCRKKKNLRRNS
jgi:hypothetical protein